MTTQDPASDRNPYVGPRAFEAGEADLFHGRRRELASLADLLIAERIVLLHSPSGAGKTSLIQAGLVPRLQKEGFRVLPTIRVGQEPDAPEGVAAPNRYIFSALLSLEEPEEIQIPLHVLAGLTLDRYLDLRTILHLEQARSQDAPLALDDLIGLSWEQYHDWRALRDLEETRPAEERIAPRELIGLTFEAYWQRRSPAAIAPGAASSGWDAPSSFRDDAFDDPAEDEAAPPRTASRVETEPELLVFDQFEEVLTVDPEDEAGKDEFFRQVGQALRRDRRRWALFAMREDYLGPLDPYLGRIPTRLANTYRLDLLREEPAIEAIRRPARLRDVPFPRRAARTLAENLRQVQARRPGGPALGLYVEPVQLQVVCRGFWERLHKARVDAIRGIQTRDVEQYAEVDNALADYYAQHVATIAAETRADERAIREWFEYDLITAQDRRDLVRMDAAIERLGPDAVHRLRDAYLVREVPRHGEVWLELAHDRLILPIKKDNAAWFPTKLSAMQLQAVLWDRQGRPDKFLLRGEALDQAERWAGGREIEGIDAEFLAASQRTLSGADRVRQYLYRNLLIAASVLITFLVAVLAIAVWNWLAAREAERVALEERTQAQALQLAAKAASFSFLKDQPDLALLLALEAIRKQDNVETRSSLLGALEATPQLTTYLRDHSGPVNGVAFSPDGRFLASGGADGSILLRDAETLKILASLKKHEGQVLCLAFDPKGRMLASGGEDRMIRLWDVEARTEIPGPHRPFQEHSAGVLGLAFSPDGQILASSGTDKTIRLWDVRAGISRLLDEGFEGGTSALAFNPDGKTVAAGGRVRGERVGWFVVEGEIRFWDVATGARSEPSIRGLSDSVRCLAFSPEGSILASGHDGRAEVHLWDARTREPIAYPLIGHTSGVTSLAFGQGPKAGSPAIGMEEAAPVPLFLASSGADKTILVRDVREETTLFTATGEAHDPKGNLFRVAVQSRRFRGDRLSGHKAAVASVAFRNDGRTLASGSADGAVIVWDVTRRQRLGTVLQDSSDVETRLVLSPDGTRLARFPNLDRTIRVYGVGKQPVILRGMEDLAHCVAFSPDGKALASVAENDEVSLWDLARPERRFTFKVNESFALNLAFSPDSRTLAAGDVDGTIHLWDTTTGEKVWSLVGQHEPDPYAGAMTFSPDGRILAASDDDGTIRLWSTATGELSGSLAGHEASVPGLAFSPDGRSLASGGFDAVVLLWDVRRARLLGKPLTGHQASVFAVAFSPDGRSLASGDDEGAVILWDVTTRRPVGPPLIGYPAAGYPAEIQNLTFRADGRTLAVVHSPGANPGGYAISWDLNVASWQARACRIAGRNLSLEEWREFIGDEPYRKTCPELPDILPGSR